MPRPRLRRGRPALLAAVVATAATAVGATPAIADDVQPPTPPGTLTDNPFDFGVTRLTWSASSDDVGVTAYDVIDGVSGINSVAKVIQTVDGSTTEAVFSAPVYGPLGFHRLTVVARDAAGNVSPESNEIKTYGCGFDMNGAVPPTNLASSQVTATSAKVSWTLGTPPDWCYHAPEGYMVLVNGIVRDTVAAAQTSYTLTGLAASTTYTVEVRALRYTGPMPNPRAVSITFGTSDPTPTPTPGPVDCATVSEPTQVSYGYDLAGSATLKTLVKGSLPLKGGIAAKLGVPSGCFSADLTLNQTTGNLVALGFLPVTAVVGIVATEKVTGQLKAGVLKANAKVRIKLPKVSLFGVQIGGGATCQAKQISSIALQSTQAQFLPLTGGPIAGTFSISDLTGCGALNGIISPLTAGKGNAILLNLTPKD